MELTIIPKYEPKPCGRTSIVRFCNLNRKTHQILFNVCTTRELSLMECSRVVFAIDKGTGQWYFSVGGEELTEGSVLKEFQTRKNLAPTVRCYQAAVVNAILDKANIETGASFLISHTPKREGGREWYRIMTASPYECRRHTFK